MKLDGLDDLRVETEMAGLPDGVMQIQAPKQEVWRKCRLLQCPVVLGMGRLLPKAPGYIPL